MTLNYRVLIKGSTFLASHICIIVFCEILNIMYKYHSFHNPSVIQYYTHASDVPRLFEFLFFLTEGIIIRVFVSIATVLFNRFHVNVYDTKFVN